MKTMYVYIISSRSKTLYIGVTNDLKRRMLEHKSKTNMGFSTRYNVTKLVYFEETNDATAAIEREKSLKGLLRSKKIALIERSNPDWNDLAEEW